jgi:hypothetical protein
MNRHTRHTLARFLRLGVMSCVLLCCLIALQTPALAVAIYDALAQVSVSAPGPLPPGTGITFPFFTPIAVQSEMGNAAASASATQAPPGTFSAIVTGIASPGAPDNSRAFSSATGAGFVSVFNQNATSVLFPLTIAHHLSALTAEIPSSESGGATAQASFDVFLGAVQRLADGSINLCGSNDLEPILRPQCSIEDIGTTTVLLPLNPGSLGLNIFLSASGQAGSPEVVPEPATLLLFGTTMAGLGLARWRRRKPG